MKVGHTESSSFSLRLRDVEMNILEKVAESPRPGVEIIDICARPHRALVFSPRLSNPAYRQGHDLHLGNRDWIAPGLPRVVAIVTPLSRRNVPRGSRLIFFGRLTRFPVSVFPFPLRTFLPHEKENRRAMIRSSKSRILGIDRISPVALRPKRVL